MSGIYLHIPFCKQACHYCNFHFSTSLKQKDAFITAMIKEIRLQPSATDIIETIYFGGGTPSILETEDLKKLLDELYKKFQINPEAEITLEANPDDITDTKLKQWKDAGINRFSVGIQSFNEEELRWMNRAHSAGEALDCIDMIRDAGFTNFSVDLIYGSPLLTDAAWEKNMETVISKNVPHVSCYALTVEPKTALDKMILLQKKQAVDAEKQASQFLQLMQWMRAGGYEHYEISNYARPGFRSKHNNSYWQGKPYSGFGPSAHSYNGKARRWNVANNALYIRSLEKDIVPFEEEILTSTQQLNEYIMTSLRTIEGMDLNYVKEAFGIRSAEILQTGLIKWISKVKNQDSKIILTDEGKLFADGIAADLLF